MLRVMTTKLLEYSPTKKSATELDAPIPGKQFFGLKFSFEQTKVFFVLKSIEFKQIYHALINLITKNIT